MTSTSSSSALPTATATVLAFAALPATNASVCYTNAFGYSSCGSSWGYASWGISLGVLVLIFLFIGLFCFRSHREERDEEIANMAYVQNSQRLMPTTYAATYDPERGAAATHGPGYDQRARPTSYSAPYVSNIGVDNEPQYPKTAYPFTGYSVTPPPSHKSTRVHSTSKTKDAV